jgi:hypothetical protein
MAQCTPGSQEALTKVLINHLATNGHEVRKKKLPTTCPRSVINKSAQRRPPASTTFWSKISNLTERNLCLKNSLMKMLELSPSEFTEYVPKVDIMVPGLEGVSFFQSRFQHLNNLQETEAPMTVLKILYSMFIFLAADYIRSERDH